MVLSETIYEGQTIAVHRCCFSNFHVPPSSEKKLNTPDPDKSKRLVLQAPVPIQLPEYKVTI